jgi:hypothetical protein
MRMCHRYRLSGRLGKGKVLIEGVVDGEINDSDMNIVARQPTRD